MFSMWYKGGYKEISFELAIGVSLASTREGRRLRLSDGRGASLSDGGGANLRILTYKVSKRVDIMLYFLNMFSKKFFLLSVMDKLS